MTPSLLAASLVIGALPAFAGSFVIDFQGTGGTTAAGAAAFENTNQVLPGAGTLYTTAAQQTAGGSDIGSDITVTLSHANLPNGNLDFRSVSRNGAAGETVNDWIGVDSRNGGTNVSLTITISGLAAGDYTWLSNHHDGGTGVTNGNQAAPATLTFNSASPQVVDAAFAHSAGNGGNTSYAQFSTAFTSDGSDVSLTIAVNDTGIADFGFINDVTIANAIPEPSTALLGLLGGLGLLRRRR